MFPDLFDALRSHFTTQGYWTVAFTLLLENAGIPLPGESVLLFASFLAHEHHELNLALIILVGTAACTLGDNLGYWIGYRGGRALLHRYRGLFHVSDRAIQRGEKLFESYGSVAILFSRFVIGMRVIAGPLAGVLRMPWRKFAVYNFLGAAWWVATVSVVGFLMGHHWDKLVEIVTRIHVVAIGGLALLIFFLWRRNRRRPN